MQDTPPAIANEAANANDTIDHLDHTQELITLEHTSEQTSKPKKRGRKRRKPASVDNEREDDEEAPRRSHRRRQPPTQLREELLESLRVH